MHGLEELKRFLLRRIIRVQHALGKPQRQRAVLVAAKGGNGVFAYKKLYDASNAVLPRVVDNLDATTEKLLRCHDAHVEEALGGVEVWRVQVWTF